jgi:hypothetical protein
MHPMEREIVAHLELGREITIEVLGGVAAVVASADLLADSRFKPEIVGALVAFWAKSSRNQDQLLQVTLTSLLAGTENDLTLMGVIDVLDAQRPLPGRADEICFSSFLAKAKDISLPADTRGIAAEGSFRWAVANRRWQLRLLDFLLGISVSEAPELIRRVAKLSGVAHTYWHEPELLGKLKEFTENAETATDASFELGMASLMDGLDADGQSAALASFNLAKNWFEKSVSHSEVNPEARLFLECLHLITAYQSVANRQMFVDTFNRISSSAFELTAWFDTQDSPSWLGTRRLQALYWNQLALALEGLLDEFDKASWWQPAAVIEEHVLAVYSVSRFILRRGPDGNINSLLRPRIVASLARHRGQAHHLKTWIRKNSSHEWAFEAQQLLAEVERDASESGFSVNPSDAAIERISIAALIDKQYLPEQTKRTLLQVIHSAVAIHADNLTGAEIDIIVDAVGDAKRYPDYQTNPHAQRLFESILLWLVRFLYNRLEMTRADDPTVEYLFQRADGKNATEDALQDDFFRWLTTNAAGSDLEATNLGGGRADLRLKSSSERVVVEVKRELQDSSFDSLAASYEAQTTDYQNVSIRLGFLLVLDLSINSDEGTPHIRSLVQTRPVQRTGEAHPRLMVIARIPGNRKRPSDLTKTAKARKCK